MEGERQVDVNPHDRLEWAVARAASEKRYARFARGAAYMILSLAGVQTVMGVANEMAKDHKSAAVNMVAIGIFSYLSRRTYRSSYKYERNAQEELMRVEVLAQEATSQSLE